MTDSFTSPAPSGANSYSRGWDRHRSAEAPWPGANQERTRHPTRPPCMTSQRRVEGVHVRPRTRTTANCNQILAKGRWDDRFGGARDGHYHAIVELHQRGIDGRATQQLINYIPRHYTRQIKVTAGQYFNPGSAQPPLQLRAMIAAEMPENGIKLAHEEG